MCHDGWMRMNEKENFLQNCTVSLNNLGIMDVTKPDKSRVSQSREGPAMTCDWSLNIPINVCVASVLFSTTILINNNITD